MTTNIEQKPVVASSEVSQALELLDERLSVWGAGDRKIVGIDEVVDLALDLRNILGN